jgi:predicted phage tail component-like protein
MTLRWAGMVGRFQFNDIESDDFDLVCKSIKRPLLPAVKVKRVELSGLSGVYDFEDDHEYSLRPIRMRIAYIGDDYEELRTRARDIAAWLSTSTWAKLIIHDEPDKYYLAKVTEELDLRTLFEGGFVELAFDCQPFAYSVNEEVVIFEAVAEKAEEFTNPGTRRINYKSPQGSKFLIKVTGTWTDLNLALNGKTLYYTEAKAGAGTVIFDNIEMETTLGGVNKFTVIGGDFDTFLHIIPGKNTLTVNGTAIDVEVTVEYIPLWL